MKKILLGLLLIGSVAMAQWDTVEMVDEFGDKTGEVSIFNEESKGAYIQLTSLGFLIKTNGYLNNSDYGVMKVKSDDGSIHSFKVFQDGKSAHLFNSMAGYDKLINLLKSSSTLKVVVYSYDNDAYKLKINCMGFTKALKKVK